LRYSIIFEKYRENHKILEITPPVAPIDISGCEANQYRDEIREKTRTSARRVGSGKSKIGGEGAKKRNGWKEREDWNVVNFRLQKTNAQIVFP
jgi:hypothetical protein